jgi:hypothetical protein
MIRICLGPRAETVLGRHGERAAMDMLLLGSGVYIISLEGKYWTSR